MGGRAFSGDSTGSAGCSVWTAVGAAAGAGDIAGAKTSGAAVAALLRPRPCQLRPRPSLCALDHAYGYYKYISLKLLLQYPFCSWKPRLLGFYTSPRSWRSAMSCVCMQWENQFLGQGCAGPAQGQRVPRFIANSPLEDLTRSASVPWWLGHPPFRHCDTPTRTIRHCNDSPHKHLHIVIIRLLWGRTVLTPPNRSVRPHWSGSKCWLWQSDLRTIWPILCSTRRGGGDSSDHDTQMALFKNSAAPPERTSLMHGSVRHKPDLT